MMTSSDLRAWRARRKWTQAYAAKKLGVSRHGYQRAEGVSGDISRRMELAVKGVDSEDGE